MSSRTAVAKPSTSKWVDIQDGTEVSFGSTGSPPPATGTLFGSTIAGQGLGPAQIVRTYSTSGANIPTTWSAIAASNVTGVESGATLVCDGIRPGGLGGSVGWSSNSTYRNQLEQYLAALPDVPNFRLTCVHEPEDGSRAYGSGNTSAYLTDSAYFATRVRAASNLRTYPFIIVRCFMGYSMTNNPTLMNAMCANPGDFDELGADIYDLSQVNPTITRARNLGKPWSCPELGNKTINSGTTTTDSAVVNFMNAIVPNLRGVAAWGAWFNSGPRNTLSDKPNSRALWSTVCQGGPP